MNHATNTQVKLTRTCTKHIHAWRDDIWRKSLAAAVVVLTADINDIYIGEDDRDNNNDENNNGNNGKNKHQPYQHQLTEF